MEKHFPSSAFIHMPHLKEHYTYSQLKSYVETLRKANLYPKRKSLISIEDFTKYIFHLITSEKISNVHYLKYKFNNEPIRLIGRNKKITQSISFFLSCILYQMLTEEGYRKYIEQNITLKLSSDFCKVTNNNGLEKIFCNKDEVNPYLSHHRNLLKYTEVHVAFLVKIASDYNYFSV